MAEQTTDECIFCRIARGELGTEFVAESAHAVAFRDIEPHTPVHVLVIPKQHIQSLHDAGPDDRALLGEILLLTTDVARKEGIVEGGYRVLTNDGPNACQSVPHLHFHVLGGKQLPCRLG